ncbi:MAG: fumarate hydratase C-terminal domain-containing protein [Nitrospirae bacterium]|nr:fumarate hydratase C-terminal domain-containing protein [Nitrospirota bacterium]
MSADESPEATRFKGRKEKTINLPLTKKDALSLKVGDMVLINGLLVTGRDKLHKFLVNEKPQKRDIPFNLDGTVLYHCGPIVIPPHPPLEKGGRGDFRVIAAGPTTSVRVEMYEHEVISKYGLRGIMGKGGMGQSALDAMKENACVYLHTIGGAAVYLADRIKNVVDVWKLEEFGTTEAMWLLEVENFPAIVTMDAHGKSMHKKIEKKSLANFKRLIK